VPQAAPELEGELDGEASLAGGVAEQVGGAGDPLKDRVAVGVEAGGRPSVALMKSVARCSSWAASTVISSSS
jgi:hypothetical protein